MADPRWARQPSERRFLGYGSSTGVIDADGTRRVTVYRQTLAGAGQIEQSRLENAAGQIYHKDDWSYVETGSPPYVSQVSSKVHSECNQTVNCRKSQLDYTYDIYNNVLTEVDKGDIGSGTPADETATGYTYVPNTTKYIVNRKATETTYAGTAVPGVTQLTRSVFFYDDATDAGTPPGKGDLTRTDVWNSTTGQYLTTKTGFDSYGNVTSTTDARNFTSTTVFDPTYHVFPIRACNALDQCTDTTWDVGFGEPTIVTDANNAVTEHTYDTLGRPETTKDPANNVTQWSYLNVGDPAQQRIRQTQPDGTTDKLWTETYIDGLGGEYQTVKEGPSAGVTFVQDRIYRSTTNLAWKQSRWRQAGQPPIYTVFTYDGADRTTRTTHPGGAFTTSTYSIDADKLPTVTAVDELGHEKTTWSDVDGLLAKVREKNGASFYTTTYQHDLLGRLVKWTDALGNFSTVSYNSLGWKTEMSDMDTGTFWRSCGTAAPRKDSAEREEISLVLAVQLVRTPDHVGRIMFPVRVADLCGEHPVSRDGMRRYLAEAHVGTEPTEPQVEGALTYVNSILAMGPLTKAEAFQMLFRVAREELAPRLSTMAW